MSELRAFEILMSCVTLVSGWFIGNKNVWGQRLALLANLMWWIYIPWSGAWGLAPMEVGFSLIVVRAWVKWEREARHAREKEQPAPA